MLFWPDHTLYTLKKSMTDATITIKITERSFYRSEMASCAAYLLLFAMNDAHDVPASEVHHVLHQNRLDLFDCLFHLAEARHIEGTEGTSLSVVRIILNETVRDRDALLVQLLVVHALSSIKAIRS